MVSLVVTYYPPRLKGSDNMKNGMSLVLPFLVPLYNATVPFNVPVIRFYMQHDRSPTYHGRMSRTKRAAKPFGHHEDGKWKTLKSLSASYGGGKWWLVTKGSIYLDPHSYTLCHRMFMLRYSMQLSSL